MSHQDLSDELFRTRRLRPYLITGGRTEPRIDLPIETIVRTTPEGTAMLSTLNHESEAVVMLCVAPQAIAEIAARLHVPLQVARVLVGDLVSSGHVAVNEPIAPDRPQVHLLERVLEGLRTL